MAVVDKKTEARDEEVLDRRISISLRWNWEIAAYASLIAIAFVLRFWDLGTRMLHHDESLHATYSWYLYIGRGYKHDPMMHGPFQFTFMALMYFLLGVSNATVRVLAALFGTALVGLPFLLRNQMGKSGALVASFLLAFSPSFLYFSRFAREDAYVIVWTMALVVLMFMYFERKRPLYLYLLAAVLSLSYATKENTYITMAIFGSFLLLVTGTDFLKILKRSGSVSAPTDVMLLFGTFLLPLLTGFAVRGEKFLNLSSRSTSEYVFLSVVFVALAAISVAVGLRWNARVWVWCAVIFWGIFTVLFTTFFGNPEGFASGAVGGLKYWLEQQGVARGDQPWYYYLVLLPIYEFVPIIFALGGVVYFAIRRSLFTTFLIYWLFASMLLYGWAAEKMPWLLLHMALPMVLLAATTLGRLIDSPALRRASARYAAYLGVLLVLVCAVLFALLNRPQTPGGLVPIQQQQLTLQTLALAVALAALVGGVIYLERRLGTRTALAIAAVTLFVVLMPLSMHAAWQVTYVNSDVPVEMMVYTQTSPDVGLVMKEIERVGFRTGTGKDLKVAYDSSVSWPFEWYLRDYRYRNFYGDGMPAQDAPVVLVGFEGDHDARVKPALGNNYIGQRYKLRWWFPEDYRGMTFQRIWQGITDPVVRNKVWRFFIYREPFSQLGSTDFMLYVRKDLVAGPWATKAGAGLPAGSAAVAPSVDAYASMVKPIAGAQVWGAKGAAPGQFQAPRGIAVGPDSSIYVLDTGNNRVEKLDAQGKFLLAWGKKGQAPGEFSEPWGIAVDDKGNVYVADTWNHRIQKFDQNGQFLATWGKYGNTADPKAAPGDFFGPRSILIDSRGFAYVADTGNHRLQKFDGAGNFVAAVGGRGTAPGQFNEPVGLALDKNGSILVADTWNRRIQRFDVDLKPVQQWPITSGWNSNMPNNKPYVATDIQGNIFATDPENHRVLQFDSKGTIVAVWGKYGNDQSSLQNPTGLAVDSAGRVLVADSLNDRVMRFAPVR